MNMPTDIQAAVDVLYNELDQLEKQMISNHSFTNDEAEQLERLVAKAIKYGELVAKRDNQGSNIVLHESHIDDALDSSPCAIEDILNHVQNVIISKSLILTHGNVTKAAQLVGWNRGTFAKRKNRNR